MERLPAKEIALDDDDDPNKSAQVVAARSGAGSMPDSRRTSQTVDGATYPKGEQFAVQATVAPTAVLRRQPQDQGADRAQRAGPAAPFRSGDGCVAAGDEVAVPPHDRVRAHQEPQAPQR